MAPFPAGPNIAEWLQQVWERGKSLTPEPHLVEGHYYLVQFDIDPPWLERSEPALCSAS